MNRPFIVAEISANHRSSLETALEIVSVAAHSGADAVKLQTWTLGTMVTDDTYVMISGPWGGSNLAKLYDECHTPWEWHGPIFQHARDLGIEAFSTPFDLGALQFLEQLKCPRYKVSSFDIVNLDLIAAIAATGKPMIMSTGMATDTEIHRAVKATGRLKMFQPIGGGPEGIETVENLTLLKCTSAYPASSADANLVTMVDMLRTYGCAVGVSDHTLGGAVAVAATALGATVIEKHLTLRRADGGPDAAFSMEPHEFHALVEGCREVASTLGQVRYGPLEAELPMLAVRRARSKVSRETTDSSPS